MSKHNHRHDTSNINWHDYFYYDETSPSCLRWKVTRIRTNGYPCGKARKDKSAGRLHNKQNRWDVRVNGVLYKVHRVVWEMFHNVVPTDMKIDHINGNASDNRIENLRAVTHQINMQNVKMRIDNKSGVVGVSVITNNGYTYVVAQGKSLDGGHWSKRFSVSKLGYDNAFRLACEYRAKMIEELNAQGMGYTNRHGMPLDNDTQQML